MNCQPSFRTGSVPIAAPALDGPGWAWTDASLDGPGPTRERPQRRVPDCDIVYVGPRRRAAARHEAVDVRELAYADERGTEVRPPVPAARTRLRRYTRPAVALLILELITVGGFYLKKRYAEAHVIVVPATADERAVIT